MPEVPWELRLTLRPGSVYYFTERALTSAEPHFFIVVNRDPVGSEVLLLTVITSQVEKVKRFRRDLPGTLVELDPGLYDELRKPSVVDGNSIFTKSLDEFVDLFSRKEIRHHKDIPASLLADIQSAILESPLVTPDEKARITANP